MHKVRAGALVLLALVFATACSTQLSPGNILSGQVFMQLAMGTLNDSLGTISLVATGASAPGTYLNAVSTFRNNLGASAFAQPGNGYLHGPAVGKLLVGGLFSYGQGPGVNGVTGQLPAYNPASAVKAGYATGFIFTGAAPTPGGYSITTIPSVNGQNQQYGASSALPTSPTVLGAYSVPIYAPVAGTGGGTLTVSPPAGVTETLIVICSPAPPPAPFSCNGSNEVATAVTHGGAATLPPGTLAPGSYSAFALGADYPLVEAGPPANTATTPTLTGAAGTADLTASGQTTITQT
ncbi:MAG: hypothetical protein JO009_05905 [Candidatus Eremiobacteraeota bacterium]|nr:hypothetical protein [Candidatus Eremiobacteraeota bacterium]